MLCPVPVHLTDATDSTTATAATFPPAARSPPPAPPLGPRPSGCTHWSLGQFKARAVREASVRLPQPDRQSACSRGQPRHSCTTPSSVTRCGAKRTVRGRGHHAEPPATARGYPRLNVHPDSATRTRLSTEKTGIMFPLHSFRIFKPY